MDKENDEKLEAMQEVATFLVAGVDHAFGKDTQSTVIIYDNEGRVTMASDSPPEIAIHVLRSALERVEESYARADGGDLRPWDGGPNPWTETDPN